MAKRTRVAEYFDFSEPFESTAGGPMNVIMEIDCQYLIDQYVYHDAPSQLEVCFDKEKLVELQNHITTLLEKMQ